MGSGIYRQHVCRAMLMCSVAALTAACSSSDPPARSIAGGRDSISRPLFSESDYGVDSSPRVTGPARKGGGAFKLGSPYKVAGRWYIPREEPDYDKTGIASWYGDDFHGRRTANGEIFDKTALSAAHPTLPLPSYVWVTNLGNGRTVLVRVNDRGPYVNDRMIDMSHAAAEALGYKNQGRARVRVRYAGRAPLNGDDRRERQFLAQQPWSGGNAVANSSQPPMPAYAYRTTDSGAADTTGGWTAASYRLSLAGKPAPQPAFAPPPRAFAQTASLPQRPAYAGAPTFQNTTDNGDDGRGPREGGQTYLQVGIFRERANAERLRRDLGSIGPVEVAPLPGSGGDQFFRVRLGPMSPTQAAQAASDVASRGVLGSQIVTE